MYVDKIRNKLNGLTNCVGFIDGTVIGIARPSGSHMLQFVAYNGHKRKHFPKFQTVTRPDGMILHAYGPLEGRRHDWTLWCRSGLEEILPVSLDTDGERYCLGWSQQRGEWSRCLVIWLHR